jgi:hypothetical protein
MHLETITEGSLENENYRLRWGVYLDTDTRFTGMEWARLTCKASGEEHSGRKAILTRIFDGIITVDEFYSPGGK